MPPTFPDHSAQEQIIRVVGDAELLYKRGEKILRWQKAYWGQAADAWRYELIKPYVHDRVLHLGVGLGLSLESILVAPGVTEIIAYEWLQDVADIWNAEHAADPRLTLTVADAHANKPTGSFHSIVYELPLNVADEYDKTKAYLTWCWGRLDAGGHFLIPVDRFARALLVEFPQLAWIELSASGRDLAPIPVWIVVTK
jgi:hypothetical protein